MQPKQIDRKEEIPDLCNCSFCEWIRGETEEERVRLGFDAEIEEYKKVCGVYEEE